MDVALWPFTIESQHHDEHYESRCLQECTGEACIGDALIKLMGALPRAQWILTTLGKRGSVLVQRGNATPDNTEV